MSWEVTRHRGSADELHHLDVASPGRSVQVMELDAPSIALGSTQSDAVLDATVRYSERDVTRRHSGGGLVLMNPGDVAWVDVIIPAGDPHWCDDVGEAFVWLGDAWAEALGEAGAAVHRGAPLHADLGRAVCFAGLGSGEVSVGTRKVVGMSQRRTRDWARFQCLVHQRFDADESLSVLAPHLTAGGFGERLRSRLVEGVGIVDDAAGAVDALIAVLHHG